MKQPTILWHYTNAEGFYGIVSSHLLRLADAQFLNDRTERTYGVEMVIDIIDRVAKSKPSEIINSVRAELDNPLDTNLFICSFS